jgi:hypothetical protein
MRRLLWLAIVSAFPILLLSPTAALAAVPPDCAPPASESTLTGVFPAPPLSILNQPALQVTLTGTSGSFRGHIVFQPQAVPPPGLSDGCQENSRFTISDFTGTLSVSGPLAAQLFGVSPFQAIATQPIDASLEVHFGTQPSRPLLTFRSKQPVQTSFGPLRFLQIVGGHIIHTR